LSLFCGPILYIFLSNDLGLFVSTPNYWGEGDGGVGESCPPPPKQRKA